MNYITLPNEVRINLDQVLKYEPSRWSRTITFSFNKLDHNTYQEEHFEFDTVEEMEMFLKRLDLFTKSNINIEVEDETIGQ